MKIAFLSSLDPLNINNWSGTLYYIFTSLKKYHEVHWVEQDLFHKGFLLHTENSSHSTFLPEIYANNFGEYLSSSLFSETYDIIIARDYFYIAYLKIDKPIVYIGDTNFHLFKEYLNLQEGKFMKLADKLEQLSISNADSIIYPSTWAKEAAINHYNADPQKVHIVEFGANLTSVPQKIDFLNSECNDNICNILFIGKNWYYKGGGTAYETYRHLKNEGFNCSLTIIGCDPEDIDRNDEKLKIIPFIDKKDEKQNKILEQIFIDSHFFVLPTFFDCYGIVFCEASAYGIPSLAADVGGVHQVIIDNENGFLLPSTATPRDYARIIKKKFKNKKKYLALRRSTRKRYEDVLNWDVWTKKVNVILNNINNPIS